MGNGIVKALVEGFEGFMEMMVQTIIEFIANIFTEAIDVMLRTPHPNNMSGGYLNPTNGVWPEIYSHVQPGGNIYNAAIGILIFLWFLSIIADGMSLGESGGLGNLNNKFWLAIVAIHGPGLMVMGAGTAIFDALVTEVIAPSPEAVTSTFTTMIGAMGATGIVALLASGASVTVIAAMLLLYFGRILLIYTYFYFFPILVATWAADVWLLKPVSQMAGGLLKKFPTILFLPLPTAAIFQMTVILWQGTTLDAGGIIQFLMTLVAPVLALLIPQQMLSGGLGRLTSRSSRSLRRMQRVRSRGSRRRSSSGNQNGPSGNVAATGASAGAGAATAQTADEPTGYKQTTLNGEFQNPQKGGATGDDYNSVRSRVKGKLGEKASSAMGTTKDKLGGEGTMGNRKTDRYTSPYMPVSMNRAKNRFRKMQEIGERGAMRTNKMAGHPASKRTISNAKDAAKQKYTESGAKNAVQVGQDATRNAKESIRDGYQERKEQAVGETVRRMVGDDMAEKGGTSPNFDNTQFNESSETKEFTDTFDMSEEETEFGGGFQRAEVQDSKEK